MDQPSDWDLLREYATENSEAAFSTLVQRKIDLVHSAAVRQVRDAALAEDITQTVFIALATKASSFRSGANISAWLYRATQFATANVLKSKRRREKREKTAAEMETLTSDDDRIWQQISRRSRAVAHRWFPETRKSRSPNG